MGERMGLTTPPSSDSVARSCSLGPPGLWQRCRGDEEVFLPLGSLGLWGGTGRQWRQFPAPQVRPPPGPLGLCALHTCVLPRPWGRWPLARPEAWRLESLVHVQGQEAGPVGQGGAVSVEEEAGGAAGSKGLHHSGPQAEGPQADRDGASLLGGGGAWPPGSCRAPRLHPDCRLSTLASGPGCCWPLAAPGG